MVNGGGTALQGGWQCQGSMQRISVAQAGGHLQEQPLGVPGHLLHVEAFILGGFVAAQVPDAKAIRRGHQRGGQTLQRTRPQLPFRL